MNREIGYYWCYGVKWWQSKSWAIFYWDGHMFWNGDEDLSESSIEIIDENQIKRV